MAEIIKPDMSSLWASGGAIIAPTSEKVSTGWTPEIPPHQWQNWWQNRADQSLVYLMQKGIPEWDAGTEYFIGRSFVQRSGVIFKSLTNNTGRDPSTNPSDWTPVASVATSAQAQGMTDDVALLTPKKLSDAFQGPNQSKANNGFQKLPGGLILQWVRNRQATSDASGTANITVTYPIPFTSAVYSAVFSPTDELIIRPGRKIVSGFPNLTSVRVTIDGDPNTDLAVNGFIIGV